MENLGLGFMLMFIEMLTVFIILLLSIFRSDLLIKGVNKVAPEEAAPTHNAAPAAPAVDGLTMDIIKAAVSQLTGGKGQVASVEKV